MPEKEKRKSTKRKAEKEYVEPDNVKPPPPPPSNQPKPQFGKEVEPGRWLLLLGSFCIAVAFGLAIVSAFQPWWSDEAKTGEDTQHTEVTFWVVKTQITMQSEEVEHFGCDSSCDQTRVINNKVRTKEQTWDDTCRRAKGQTQDTCVKLNVMRGSLGIGVLIAFVYLLPTCISFTGSENRSVLRFNPVVAAIFGVCTALSIGVTLVAAITVDGKVPYAGDDLGQDRQQQLNGEGFIMCIAAFSFTVPAILMAILSQAAVNICEKAPFGWDDDDRPPLRTWSAAFAEAPAVQKIAWPEDEPGLV